MCVTTGARLSGTTTRCRPLASLNSLTRRPEPAWAFAKHDTVSMRARRRLERRLADVHMEQRVLSARAAPRRVGTKARVATEAAAAQRAGEPHLLGVWSSKSNDNSLMSPRPRLSGHSARCLTCSD